MYLVFLAGRLHRPCPSGKSYRRGLTIHPALEPWLVFASDIIAAKGYAYG